MEFYQQRYQQQQIKWMQKKARDLGLVITLAPRPPFHEFRQADVDVGRRTGVLDWSPAPR